ncbi:hypothetical protein HDU85_007042 [Gaertneriomyces sp. JEL0708]|nr:hypothetical protein HDU85_007042 [Gaertneriomyces sp. JEL0708]
MAREQVNFYQGFHPPNREWVPERVDPGQITPKDFYEKFVATRTPCILTKPLPDQAWKGTDKWTLDYLKRVAGDVVVHVERAETDNSSFGSSKPREEFKFVDFVNALQNGDRTLYMTTQYHNTANEGLTDQADIQRLLEFCAPPVNTLLNDYPLSPSILNSLVTLMVNLWMGGVDANSNGTSSGLHHDYHDNLYILLRGRKRFTLFSPRDAERMYLQGTIEKVYANGNIKYANTGRTREDGADLMEVAKWQVAEAEKNLERAEKSGTGIDEAEEQLDEAMSVLTRFQVEDGVDDFEDFDEGEAGETEDDSSEDEGDDGFFPGEKRKGLCAEETNAKRSKLDGTDFEEEDDMAPPSQGLEPPSFSRIPAAELHLKTPSGNYPLLNDATQVSFSVNKGEMLYLPAGWFHEVTSYGDADDGIHMAFNYWMAPPTTKDADKPYEDGYWCSVRDEISSLVKRHANASGRIPTCRRANGCDADARK